jgi:hypothetical protein
MNKAKWKKGSRFSREGSILVDAERERVFPLLCPVEEYKWLEGWSCTMIYSESGVAEKDAVFLTTKTHHLRATWTVATYEAPALIEYLIVSGSSAVVRLSVALASAGLGRTELRWIMLFTAATRLAARILAKGFGPEAFARMLELRRVELASFLETGTMLPD